MCTTVVNTWWAQHAPPPPPHPLPHHNPLDHFVQWPVGWQAAHACCHTAELRQKYGAMAKALQRAELLRALPPQRGGAANSVPCVLVFLCGVE